MPFLLGSGPAAVVLVCASCASPPPASPPETLTVGAQGDITGLYPNVRNESYTFAINTSIFEGLTRFGRDLRPEPAAADRWESPDDKTWVFHVRRGLRFSNGEPVHAADVVASLRFAQQAEPLQYLLAPIETIEEATPEDVRIRTRFPFPTLLAHLTDAFILPAAALHEHPIPSIGTGPFKLEAWSPGKELDLVENPSYRGPKPGFSRVRLLVTPDRGARVRDLLSGRAQLIENVPLEEIAGLRKNASVRVVIRPSLRVLFLILRTNEPPFSNPLVRQAFELAIDRSELVTRALNGFGTPALELVPPAVLGYNPSIAAVPPDRARARDLLKAAGYPNGFATRLEGPSNRYSNGIEIMKEVARELGEIGVRVESHPTPKEHVFNLLGAAGWHLMLFGWSCETVQAGEVLDEVVHTPRPPETVNYAGFSDPKLDALIDAADKSPLLSEKAEKLAEALKRAAETGAFVPLVTQNESFALSNSIDWDPSLDMALRVAEIKPRRGPE